MTRPIKLKDAVQIQLSYHLPREAGWQSGHAAVCNTVYAGSIPTPASNHPHFYWPHSHPLLQRPVKPSYMLFHGFSCFCVLITLKPEIV